MVLPYGLVWDISINITKVKFMRKTALLKKFYVPKERSRVSMLADTWWYKSYIVLVAIPAVNFCVEFGMMTRSIVRI